MVLSNAQWMASAAATTYEIDNSCSFDATNDYLTKTYGSAGNQKTFTISCWVKRSKLDSSATNQGILSAGTSGNNRGGLFFVADEIHFSFSYGGTWYELKSSAKYRDTSGWMNIVTKVDTTQSTASDRTKIYVNGSEISYATSGYVPEDATLPINDDIEQVIGAYSANKAANDMFGGYMADIYFIDGSALAPSNFGETSSTTGQWIPKDYTGSYGDNGYRLSFGTSSAMGDDTSGEENDFSLTGIAAANQFTDSPTKNFPTWDPQSMQANISLSEANLIATNTSNTQGLCFSTLAAKTGKKYYAEFTITTSNTVMLGVVKTTSNVTRDNTLTFDDLAANDAQVLHVASGDVYNSDTTPTVSNYAPNDSVPVTLMVALDLENDKIYWGDAGVGASGWSDGSGSYDQAFGSASGVDLTADLDWFFTARPYAGACQANFGQDSFTVDPPTGYVRLNTANFDDPATADPTAYFQTTLYTGDGSTQSINQAGNSTFDPDLVWIKDRDDTENHCWFDSVRGATKVLYSNTTDDEETDADTLTAFESDGFALGADVKVNTSSDKFVAWQWLESTTAGFDIVSDTGTGSAHTISHSLSATPEFIIRKKRTSGTDDAWIIWHTDLGGANYYLNFDDGASDTSVNYWNNTLPTSSVFSVGASNGTNQNTETFITYLFHSVDGFSKFGKYLGNNSNDGPFVYCGFSPAFVMIKGTAAEAWYVGDNKRLGYNLGNRPMLVPNTTAAEDASWSGNAPFDLYSNGFKIRRTGGAFNSDGGTYLYAAFAHSPVKYATAR